ncbi:hypothetical protein KI387_040455, partial [Taxus chinensis]
HRIKLEEALEAVNLVPPMQVVGMDWISMDGAKQVIAALSSRNTSVMRFAENVHSACAASMAGRSRIKRLDLPSLSAPIVLETEVVEKFWSK